MVANVYVMPSGIPGAITRPEVATIEAQLLDQTTPPLAYGIAVKNVAGKLQPISGNTDVPVGVLVRPYPTSGNGTDGLGVAAPSKGMPGDLLKRGYISVTVNNFASVPPVKDGVVYIRTGNASTGKVIGNFEAAAEVTAAAVAHAGNAGNGLLSALTPQTAAQAGVYNAIVKIAGTNSATWDLFDPNGNLIDQQSYSTSGGTAVFANSQIHATITDGGTDFIVGDSFQITVTANTIQFGGKETYFTGGVDAFGTAEVAYNI